MNYDLLWSKVLSNIKEKETITALAYQTWFLNTSLYKIENSEATIVVPMEIYRTKLNNYYLQDIIDSLQKETNQKYDINFILADEIPSKENISTIVVDNSNSNLEKIEYHHNSNLNKKYTFDNYVVGNSNKIAHAAAVAVAESPGELYNPLFIYGASGLGKTHLMQAIGNYIEDKYNKKVLYITPDEFIEDFSKISRKDNDNNYDYAEYFKNKYRALDVLIIDDIQFLATAQKTQEEFFHTFNILHHDKKQIIISSDRSPDDLKSLELRLRTRFTWGLPIDIYPPELELRKNIIKKKIEASTTLPEIDEMVIDYIASNMTSDVRKLEGAINRLMIESWTMGYDKITLPIAIEALKPMIDKGTSEFNNILRVQKAVADNYQISVDDIKSKKKSANIVNARQIAMYLARDILSEPFEKIGLEFGGRDHTTVMFAYNKIKDEINLRPELKGVIDKIKESLI